MAGTKNGRPLVSEEIAQDVAISGKFMWDSNRECRYRLAHASGLSACITSTILEGAGWQNSHRHLSGMIETYCIHKGWVVLAEVVGDKIQYTKFTAGESFTIQSHNAHGLYVGRRTLFATVKYGSNEGSKDWEPAPDLDKYLKSVGIKAILAML